MSKREDISKVLVIGSGPIVIGQAAEFDYAGAQACKALKDEGYYVILINSNPATIMTDSTMADKVYMEPLTVEFVTTVIKRERPCGIILGLGGQTGLNLGVELYEQGVLEKYSVEILGTSVEAIKKAEDRELFKNLMEEIDEPICESIIANNLEESISFSEKIGFPLIVRPAYTLGGTGGGIANNIDELIEITTNGLDFSPVNQCLIERSIFGYKEIEYEVMRDKNDNAIVVCNMENIDPVGIHTGDSIVVAPSQTLTDYEYQMLRDSALKIIRSLKIEGGCNVQFALDPYSFKYYVIEVNPRVSRSSALASKATGYPIAKISTKISVGMTLDEIINPVTKTTYSCFEPSLDYVVTKIPRFPFDKFEGADRNLSTQMKATGEVMALGRNFEESILKAIRSLEVKAYHLYVEKFLNITDDEINSILKKPNDERLFIIGEALRRNYTVDSIHNLTKIDKFFLYKFKNIIDIENNLKENLEDINYLRYAKEHGFSDKFLSSILNKTEKEIENIRYENKIVPIYKMVDTCACEFYSATPYFYSTYEMENESIKSNKEKIIVLGSGPIRIGQGIEFDYSTVHSILALREMGYEAIIINNNPETVSTDFEISDKLYFEPLTIEDIMHVINNENPIGVIVQFGGQTSINLTKDLVDRGVKILGTTLEDIERCEDRDLFDKVLEEQDILRPKGKSVLTPEDGLKVSRKIGYPVLVRPSFVLGGRAMEIVYDDESLYKYIKNAAKIMPNTPILVDKYLRGIEAEVDVISDGDNIFIPGILEHIERAGVHSGDSMGVYPSIRLSDDVKNKIIKISEKLCLSLNIIGLLNIQFVIENNEVYVIEVNPRSSRTVPFLSKVTTVPIANLATRVILGKKLKNEGYLDIYHSERDTYYIKSPVFSFSKLKGVDIKLGPEMKSTGEAIGVSKTLEKALYKAFISSGIKIDAQGSVLFTISDKDKEESLVLAKTFNDLGFEIFATSGTGKFLEKNGIKVKNANKLDEANKTIIDLINNNRISFIINTPSDNKKSANDFESIRSVASRRGVVCLTSLDTAKAFVDVIEMISFNCEAMPDLDYRRGDK